ncbi:MAG: tRNA dihydrouridine synthase DusB [Thermodesulfobacteriota bacterium]
MPGPRIASVLLSSPFVLAPLAGYTDLPFRLLCREEGAGLVYSEMISSHGLVYRQNNTLTLLETLTAERPVAMQLFGSDPDIMAEAAAIASEREIDFIDINMGCPVKKVIKRGAGAALMKEPQLACRIVEKTVRASRVPVLVKIRTGWNHGQKNGVDFARMMADAGASAVAVHGRTWSDGFGGRVDWDTIAMVKQALSIPVIGNGDLHSREDGLAMMAATGCDAVMIGRAALGAPWIFSPAPHPATPELRARALLRHLRLAASLAGGPPALAALKNHGGRYFKGIHDAARIRERIYRAGSWQELIDVLQHLQEGNTVT